MDLALVLDFHTAWWDKEMLFCQGIGPWQAQVPKEKQIAGYRADEYGAHVVLMRRALLALDPFALESSQFVNFRKERSKLCDEPRADGKPSTLAFMDDQVKISPWIYTSAFTTLMIKDFRQVKHFLATAKDTLGNHHVRWLRENVDCTLAHPNREVGLAMAVALLEIYDEVPLDSRVVIDPKKEVLVETNPDETEV